jgi:sugar/nucleoside kinase (ribokinase family)
MTTAFDVLGIGNAIVDVITRADDAFLAKHALTKGSMMLIDEARADALYGAMGAGIEVSGGSCGNTMAGVASFGGKGALSARCATTSSAPCSATTSRRSACRSRRRPRPPVPRPRVA